MECSINLLSREKKEMALKLKDGLLELEEEKTIWSAKGKALVESIAQKAELSNVEIGRLSEVLCKCRHDIEGKKEMTLKLKDALLGLEEEKAIFSVKEKAFIESIAQKEKLSDAEIGRLSEITKGDYLKLEIRAFELETKMTSLEEELLACHSEKQELFVRNEMLASELKATSNNLSTTKEEVSSLGQRLIESESSCQRMEYSINLLSSEKKEMALKLKDALLELEEEKAIWSVKENAFIESIAQKTELSNAKIVRLSEICRRI